MIIEYIATQPIVSNLNASAVFRIGARSINPSRRRYGAQPRAIDGTPFSQLDRIEVQISLTTIRLLEGANYDQFLEFWDSTANMEIFSIDQREDGRLQNVFRVDNRLTPRRIMRTNYLRGSFRIEVA